MVKKNALRPVMTRLPESLRAELAIKAKVGGRSMNAEIILRLQRTINRDMQPAASTVSEMRAEILDSLSCYNTSNLTSARVAAQEAADITARSIYVDIAPLVSKAVTAAMAKRPPGSQNIGADLVRACYARPPMDFNATG